MPEIEIPERKTEKETADWGIFLLSDFWIREKRLLGLDLLYFLGKIVKRKIISFKDYAYK